MCERQESGTQLEAGCSWPASVCLCQLLKTVACRKLMLLVGLPMFWKSPRKKKLSMEKGGSFGTVKFLTQNTVSIPYQYRTCSGSSDRRTTQFQCLDVSQSNQTRHRNIAASYGGILSLIFAPFGQFWLAICRTPSVIFSGHTRRQTNPTLGLSRDRDASVPGPGRAIQGGTIKCAMPEMPEAR